MLGANGYCFRLFLAQLEREKKFPLDVIGLLEKAKSVGLDGVQITSLGSFEEEKLRAIRQKADELGMYLEAANGSPTQPMFEKWVKAAAVMGCEAIRTFLGWPPRTEESLKTLEEVRAFVEKSKKDLVETEKLGRKYKMRIGVENHMDLTADEMVEIMEEVGSEYLGICFDTANCLWTAEDQVETAEKLAQYTNMVHLKDLRITSTAEGYVLDNVPLGQGHITQLPKIIGILKKGKPGLNCWSIELITGQRIKSRWLEDDFWTSFPPRGPQELARMLRLVRDTPTTGWEPVRDMEKMSLEEQIEYEESNMRRCVTYVRARWLPL